MPCRAWLSHGHLGFKIFIDLGQVLYTTCPTVLLTVNPYELGL